MSNTTTIGTNNATFDVFLRSDEQRLRQLYQENRVKFVRFATEHYECEPNKAGDIFQEVFQVLYLNIKQKNISVFDSTIEEYLMSIGESLMQQQSIIRKEKAVTESADIQTFDLSVLRKYKNNRSKPILLDLLRSMGEPCRSILKLAYFCGYSMHNIAQQVGYNNEVTAQKKKYQCLEELKSVIENQMNLKSALMND